MGVGGWIRAASVEKPAVRQHMGKKCMGSGVMGLGLSLGDFEGIVTSLVKWA